MESDTIEQNSLTGSLPVLLILPITLQKACQHRFCISLHLTGLLTYKDIYSPCSYTYVQKVYTSLDTVNFTSLPFAVPNVFMITVAVDLSCFNSINIIICILIINQKSTSDKKTKLIN